MKKKLFILLIFINIQCFSQKKNYDVEQLSVLNELRSFIKEVNISSVFEGKYNIFVVNFYLNDSKSFCFMSSYISNSFRMKYLDVPYYFNLDDNIILTKVSNNNILNYLNDSLNLQIKTFDSLKVKNEVFNILYPEEKGFITSVTKGLIICETKNNHISRSFYESSDEIPIEYSFFNNRTINNIDR